MICFTRQSSSWGRTMQMTKKNFFILSLAHRKTSKTTKRTSHVIHKSLTSYVRRKRIWPWAHELWSTFRLLLKETSSQKLQTWTHISRHHILALIPSLYSFITHLEKSTSIKINDSYAIIVVSLILFSFSREKKVNSYNTLVLNY